LKVTR